MRNSTAPFLTGWPSRKLTSTICPSTRAFNATVEYASTLPIARSSIGTVSCVTGATVTGTAGETLPPFGPSPAPLSVLEEGPNPPATHATPTAPPDREWPVGGVNGTRGGHSG